MPVQQVFVMSYTANDEMPNRELCGNAAYGSQASAQRDAETIAQNITEDPTLRLIWKDAPEYVHGATTKAWCAKNGECIFLVRAMSLRD